MNLAAIGLSVVDNLRKMIAGRQPWTAADEFAYYKIEDGTLAHHRERQVDFERESHATGLGIMRGMKLLDVHALRSQRVLDVGAGEGMLTAALAHCGAEVWAIDAVPKQIWAAAERYADTEKQRFVVGDVNSLPFNDNSFDLVTANLILHHVEPLQPMLKEINRVLRPGGRFAASEPSPLTGSLFHGHASANEAPISLTRVRRELSEAGFASTETHYWWSRGNTGALGFLSPGYRVQSQKPGSETAPRTDQVALPSLQECALPGLLVDRDCEFTKLIDGQIETIADYISRNPLQP